VPENTPAKLITFQPVRQVAHVHAALCRHALRVGDVMRRPPVAV